MRKLLSVSILFAVVGCGVSGPQLPTNLDPSIVCTPLSSFRSEIGDVVITDMLDKKTGMHYFIVSGYKSVAIYPRIGMDIPEEKK